VNAHDVPPSGDLRVSFSGMDKWNQTNWDRLLYAYRMDSGAWSPFLPSGFAMFHRLAAGEHRFEVRAMDRNGNIDPARSRCHSRSCSPGTGKSDFCRCWS